ncbi:hypothetical protein EDB87DRAFT_1687002 [Lactarius vividus]|nr:hypothetical protein EDB87DRAFT_1687002 [Lactarius vividus]
MKIFQQIKKENSGEAPALHPMLAALYIVLDADGDLAEITRTHPRLKKHTYYQPGAKFPQDISDLLLSEDHWWETLAAKSQNEAAPPDTVPRHLLKVRLILSKPPADHGVMSVDKPHNSCRATQSRRQSTKAAEGAAAAKLRKRKRASPPGGKTEKRHAGPSQLQPASTRRDEEEYESEEEDNNNNNNNNNNGEDEIKDKDEEVDEIEDDSDNNNNGKEDDKDEDEIEDMGYKFEGGLPDKANRALRPLQGEKAAVQPDAQELDYRQDRLVNFDSKASLQVSPRSGQAGQGEAADVQSQGGFRLGSIGLEDGWEDDTGKWPPSVELSPIVDSAAAPPTSSTAQPSVPAGSLATTVPSSPTPAVDHPVLTGNHSPAIAPALHQYVSVKKKTLVPYVLVPNPPCSASSSQQQVSATQESQAPSPGGSSTEALERRIAAIEDWIRAQDEDWKGGL